MSVGLEGGRNRIMIYGPKSDGTYVLEFRTSGGETLAMLPATRKLRTSHVDHLLKHNHGW